jgi:hypothetical protein
VLYKAERAGVVDGMSLLQLATEDTLNIWGMKNKRSRYVLCVMLVDVLFL